MRLFNKFSVSVGPLAVGSMLLGSILLASCGGQTSTDSPDTTGAPGPESSLKVVASFYPIAEIVERLTEGTGIEVINLTPPGVNVHDHELTAKQIDSLADADVVFHLGGGLQPSVEKAVAQLPASIAVRDLLNGIDTIEPGADKDEDDGHDHELDEHDHGDVDPHVWLDPQNMVVMVDEVLEVLRDKASIADSLDRINTNADAYSSELLALGDLIDRSFRQCETRTIVIAHDSFAYFAARANLDTVAIAGINPDAEPSAKELEGIAGVARDNGVSTVFFETAIPDSLARTVASSIGAEVDVLDPMGTLSQADIDAGKDYVGIHTTNIDKLVSALGCS